MKAINLSEPWKIAVKELEKPVPKEGEALIRVISAGICGSDIGAFRGTNNLVSYPRIMAMSWPESSSRCRRTTRKDLRWATR